MSSLNNVNVVKILFINYHYKNRKTNGSKYMNSIKSYYENNSRNKVRVICSSFNAKIPFDHSPNNLRKAKSVADKQVRAKFGNNAFTYYLNFCAPRISRASGKSADTAARFSNTVHELGHLFDFGHANIREYTKSGKPTIKRSKDPFDPMTIDPPYPSFNPVHRAQKKWYLPNELQTIVLNKQYNIYMLRNFDDKSNVKALTVTDGDSIWYVSYGTLKAVGGKAFAFHYTNNGTVSYMDKVYGVSTKRTIEHPRFPYIIDIKDIKDTYLSIVFTEKVRNSKRIKLDNVDMEIVNDMEIVDDEPEDDNENAVVDKEECKEYYKELGLDPNELDNDDDDDKVCSDDDDDEDDDDKDLS